MYENYLIPAAILLVHPVLPAPHFPAVLPAPYFPAVLPHRSSRTVLPHRFQAYAIKTESGTSCTMSLSTPQDRIAAVTHVGMLRAAEHAQFCFRSSPSIIPKKQFAIGVYT